MRICPESTLFSSGPLKPPWSKFNPPLSLLVSHHSFLVDAMSKINLQSLPFLCLHCYHPGLSGITSRLGWGSSLQMGIPGLPLPLAVQSQHSSPKWLSTHSCDCLTHSALATGVSSTYVPFVFVVPSAWNVLPSISAWPLPHFLWLYLKSYSSYGLSRPSYPNPYSFWALSLLYFSAYH